MSEFKGATVLRICSECNKEYALPLTRSSVSLEEGVHNFMDCPHCHKRQDVWIKVRVMEWQSRCDCGTCGEGLLAYELSKRDLCAYHQKGE